MPKQFWGFLAGAGVLADTVIPLIAPASHLGWERWRIPIVLCAVLALIALAIQSALTWKEEKKTAKLLEEDRKQRQEGDARFEELFSSIKGEKMAVVAPAQSLALDTLRDRVLQLGHDLFDFLREKGPRPTDSMEHLRSEDEISCEAWNKQGPYVEAIHFGYLRRFKQRAINLFQELAENHVPFNLELYEIDPPEVAREKSVRKIAEECFLIAARMLIGEKSKGT